MKKLEALGPFYSESCSVSLIKQFQSEMNSSRKTLNIAHSVSCVVLSLECYSKLYVTVNCAYNAKVRYEYDNRQL